MSPLCPSSVPVTVGTSYIDKLAVKSILGVPKAMTLEEIDDVMEDFKRGVRVAYRAGFKGVQIHGAHGFLVSQFLSPHTNRRTDDYGGSPEKRLRFLQRIVEESYVVIQEEFAANERLKVEKGVGEEVKTKTKTGFCLSVKLNSGDYMASGGLSQDEALEQVRWLLSCGKVDLVEISGGNAEQSNSGLHNSFGKVSHEANMTGTIKESTRVREAFFADFAERVKGLVEELFAEPEVPDSEEEEDGDLDGIEKKALQPPNRPAIQLSGGFRTRVGMAASIYNGLTDLCGLGRAAVLEPDLPAKVLLKDEVKDERAMAKPHMVKGLWLANWVPAKVVGSGLPIQFFYWNMRRLGRGEKPSPETTLAEMVGSEVLESLRGWVGRWVERVGKLVGGSERLTLADDTSEKHENRVREAVEEVVVLGVKA